MRLSISFVLLFSVLCVFAQNRRSNSYRQQNGYRQGNTYNQRRGTTTGESILSRLQKQTQNTQSDANRQATRQRNKKTEEMGSSSMSKDNKIGKSSDNQVREKEKDDVILVVEGSGYDKRDAIKNALRSAIEQAFGTFVSTNTAILNDELVKDEISTVASGNVKSYTELSSSNLPDGSCSVTLSAIVSTGKLISYVQAHGGTVDFDGEAFTMEMRMRRLNKANELKVFQNLVTELEGIASTLYDCSLEVGAARINPNKINNAIQDNDAYLLPIRIAVKPNSNFFSWAEKFNASLEAISLSEDEKKDWEEKGMETYILFFRGTPYILRNLYDSSLKQCVDLLNSWKLNWIINMSDGWMTFRPKEYNRKQRNCIIERTRQNSTIKRSLFIPYSSFIDTPESNPFYNEKEYAPLGFYCFFDAKGDYGYGKGVVPMAIEYEYLFRNREYRDLLGNRNDSRLRKLADHPTWYVSIELPVSDVDMEKLTSIKVEWIN